VAERLGLRPVEADYVSGVERNGPGNRIGIVPGDILDSLARVQVHKLDEVGQVLSQIKADHVVEISIHRVSRRGVERQWGSMVSR
jgi:S1-C subfamily serine protease